MSEWKTHARKPILEVGKWLTVEDRTVETPDGQVIEHWAWVITPDYVNVLAQTTEGSFLIFRQGKYGLAGESYAPVGGYIEPGEEPLAAARRELLEETGYTAEEWMPLGSYLVDPNRGVAMGNFFLAKGARLVAETSGDDLEEQHLMLLSRQEMEKALQEGKFKILAWAANIAFALLQA
jgi:ADP-ribose pyrophosphatase